MLCSHRSGTRSWSGAGDCQPPSRSPQVIIFLWWKSRVFGPMCLLFLNWCKDHFAPFRASFLSFSFFQHCCLLQHTRGVPSVGRDQVGFGAGMEMASAACCGCLLMHALRHPTLGGSALRHFQFAGHHARRTSAISAVHPDSVACVCVPGAPCASGVSPTR